MQGPSSSPILLASKKGGDTPFCVEFCDLNALSVDLKMPTLSRASRKTYNVFRAVTCSYLDLLSGFWQVEVAPEDCNKTTFTIGGGGLWRFATMSFGLTNTGSVPGLPTSREHWSQTQTLQMSPIPLKGGISLA